MRITLMDARLAALGKPKYCITGIRLFCKKHNIDFMDFARNGIEASELEKLNDSMANKILEAVRGRK